jgi:hypothetical protein
MAVDDHMLAVDTHEAGKTAVYGVVSEEMRVRLDGAEIVDTHDDNIAAFGFHDRAQDKSADAAKTVDRDADGHEFLLIAEAGRPARNASFFA